MKGVISQITGLTSKIVLDTPKSIGEAIWRFTSLSAVTALVVSGILLWRYPKIVQRMALGGTLEEQILDDIFRRKPAVKEEAMELIGGYISQYQPTQFAIINWTTQTGIEEVWVNEPTDNWPTATDGVMSRNMMAAAGSMIFDECWSGDLPYGAQFRVPKPQVIRPWLVCGLSDHYDLWSYVIVHWDHQVMPDGAVLELERLSRHLERILFKKTD